MVLPRFRYHVDPVRSGVFLHGRGVCACCGEKRQWVYAGPVIGLGDPGPLCPWCIADGSAASRLGVSFVEPAALSPDVGPGASDELRLRTPSYFSAGVEAWPVHCGDYCEVVADPPCVDDLVRNVESLREDIGLLEQKLGLPLQGIEAALGDRSSPVRFTFFRCVECGHPRLEGDYE